MKKASPDRVVDEFHSSVVQAIDDWRVIDAALEKHPIALRRRIASDAFLSLGVSWEAFLSRWLIAAINKDSTRASEMLADQIRKSAVDDLRIPETHLSSSLLVRTHFTLASVRDMVDQEGRNITLRNRSEAKKFGDKWLTDPYKQALQALRPLDFTILTGLRLVRNALAHRSPSSLGEAATFLRKETVPPNIRLTSKRTVNIDGWKSYLYADARIVEYHNEVVRIAQALRTDAP